MSEYKHGNWYCEQANEAEAKEIIERAVASGAENAGGWIGTSATCFYGVVNGYVSCNAPEDYINGNQYTIEQVREKFPLPSELKKWNGEGLPPVGTVCEVFHRAACESRPSLKECRIIELLPPHKIDNQANRLTGVVYLIDSEASREVGIADIVSFQPLRSERDRWVSEAQKHCTEFGINQLGKLYDAIKSGELKAPEVEG